MVKDAVPSIFPGPTYLSKEIKLRKSPKKRSASQPGVKRRRTAEPENVTPPQNADIEIDEPGPSEFDFDQLKNLDIDEEWIRHEIKNKNILTFIHLNDDCIPIISLKISDELIPQVRL